jgi:hypothetical protein
MPAGYLMAGVIALIIMKAVSMMVVTAVKVTV